jgi:enoyl-CoA hydratase
MKFSHLILSIEERIAILKMNRPKALNALNQEMIKELNQAVEWLDNNNDVRVIIITGEGEKSFVAGADISEFINFDKEQGRELSATGHNLLFNRISGSKKPFIAAINGFALGGGLELAMSCHIRLASNKAKMGLPESSLGVIPGYGGTQRLIQLVGKGKALEMMFSAKMIDAKTAEKYGLINASCEHESLMGDAIIMAKSFIKNSGDAQAAIIRVVNTSLEGGEGFKAEIKEFGERFGSAEFAEGTAAFMEKRKPTF